jgi:hypothetical protein
VSWWLDLAVRLRESVQSQSPILLDLCSFFGPFSFVGVALTVGESPVELIEL